MSRRLTNRIDLNLLELFVIVYRERNLTRAGGMLGLSQPAMSRALSRLRDAYSDSLFVRLPHGLMPTPAADVLYEAACAALRIVEQSLDAPTFDAATSTRTFRIAMSDTGEQVFLPTLAEALHAQAPSVQLETHPSDTSTLAADLATGTTDLAIGHVRITAPGVQQTRLFTARYACVARDHHPAIPARLTLSIFRRLRHVVVASPSTAHSSALLEILQAPAVQARIGMRVASFLSIGSLIAQTDYIAIIPRTLAMSLASVWPVRCHEPPLELGTYEVVQCWHERFARDPGLQWLRTLTQDLFFR